MSAAPDDKRRNRAVGLAEAMERALGPVLKKRGFASRDILAHWAAMAPPPFNRVSFPERLVWPRGERRAEGATLYLRCVAGHALAVAHEGAAIAAAVNRYFGYVLVGEVRLSAEPFTPHSGAVREKAGKPGEALSTTVGGAVAHIEDADLREALRTLGVAVLGRSDAKNG